MADRTKMPAQLVKYWLRGPGAARIRWGSDGDFDRCVRAITTETGKDGTPLPPDRVKGLCASLHRMATGATPGNAPGETRKH